VRRYENFAFPGTTLHRLVTGVAQENCFLVQWDGEGLLVDPGDDGRDILELVQQSGARVTAILLTHAHFDHIGAVQEVRGALGASVFLHPEAEEQYRRAGELAATWGLPFRQPEPADGALPVGPLPLGRGLEGRFTPGHAPGHVSIVSDAGFVLAGDALFKGSIGRTDLPGSDHALLLNSIESQLLSLPPDTVVFPGHGMETTVAAEALGNPFLRH
jgi:hydroxyacylglutathione hydrolase